MAEVKATILCIDDEREMIKLFKLILERYNFRIIGALTGEEGLELTQEIQPDLILLDLMMPDLNGLAVFQTIRSWQRFRKTPVIVITAKSQSADDLIELKRAGIHETISKPFRAQELVDAVRRLLGIEDK